MMAPPQYPDSRNGIPSIEENTIFAQFSNLTQYMRLTDKTCFSQGNNKQETIFPVEKKNVPTSLDSSNSPLSLTKQCFLVSSPTSCVTSGAYFTFHCQRAKTKVYPLTLIPQFLTPLLCTTHIQSTNPHLPSLTSARHTIFLDCRNSHTEKHAHNSLPN